MLRCCTLLYKMCIVVKMSRGLIAGYKWSAFPLSVAFPLWACTIAGSLLGHYNFPALCNNYIAGSCLIKCFRRFNLENCDLRNTILKRTHIISLGDGDCKNIPFLVILLSRLKLQYGIEKSAFTHAGRRT